MLKALLKLELYVQALLDAVIDQDKKLDILVSNAAANPYFGPILLTPENAWDKIFDINVKNSFQVFHFLLKS